MRWVKLLAVECLQATQWWFEQLEMAVDDLWPDDPFDRTAGRPYSVLHERSSQVPEHGGSSLHR
jgi:hypothetical protein